MKNLVLILISILFYFPSAFSESESSAMDRFIEKLTLAEESEEAQVELIVCSQNLNNFAYSGKLGKTAFGKPRRKRNIKKQTEFLVERFNKAKCDVIAVQEVAGSTIVESKNKLSILAKELRNETGKNFRVLAGESRDGRIRNGFIVSVDGIKILDTKSFHKRTIPKLNPLGPSGYYSRGPFAISLKVEKNNAPAKKFILVNVHLKSKSSSYKDPSKTKFELLRTRMAQGVKDIAWDELKKDSPEAVLLVLGDLNSESTDAASKIVAGEVGLEDIYSGACKIDKELELDCSKNLVSQERRLVRLLHQDGEMDQSHSTKGSYRYKGKYSLIDEIMIEEQASSMVREKNGSFDVGYGGRLGKGSDHKLIWAKLRWP